jgi:hypothetical protein
VLPLAIPLIISAKVLGPAPLKYSPEPPDSLIPKIFAR